MARAAGHHLQRQRLGRDRRRQSRQPAARRRGAGGRALLRRAGVDAGRGAVRADRRHLLQGRSDRASRCGSSTARSNCRPGRAWASRSTRPRSRATASSDAQRGQARHAPGRDRAPGRAMRDAGLDAIVSISPENFAYVTGFLSPTQPLMRWRHAMAVVTADGAVRARRRRHGGEHDPRQGAAGTEIAVWREFKFDAMAVLADLLAQARARQGAHRHRDGLPAGRRLRRAARRSARRRSSTPAQSAAGAAAPDQDAGRDRDPAPAVAHRRQGDHRRLPFGQAGR